jgi:hypothetical protein
MSIQRFPLFSGQPMCVIETFRIDGSAVGATSGSAGLDDRGKFLCQVKKLNNVVTIDWLRSYADAPYVFALQSAGQTDTLAEIVSETASQLVLRTVKASDNTAVNDADLVLVLVGYQTTMVVS